MTHDIRDDVLSIYDAATDARRWPDVLQRIADRIDAVGCIVFEWQAPFGDRSLHASHCSAYYDPESVRTYIDRHFADEAADQDAFEAHSLAADSIDLIEDDVLAPSSAALRAKPNVVTLQKLGILHRAAGLLNKDNTAISRFSVQFGVDRAGPTPEHRHHLGQLLPHIAKALDLGQAAAQLGRTHGGVLNLLEKLKVGICVLDPAGHVVQTNEEFQRQQAAHAVFHQDLKGKLRFRRPHDQKQFEALVTDALHHGQYGGRPRKEAIATDAEGFLCIEVAPLHQADEIGSKTFGGYILHSTDTSVPVSCDITLVQRAHGLTDSERAVMELIGQGLTNRQIAEVRGRAIATINAQVKSILSKTHCATRTQLVRMMMSFGVSYLK